MTENKLKKMMARADIGSILTQCAFDLATNFQITSRDILGMAAAQLGVTIRDVQELLRLASEQAESEKTSGPST